MEKDFDYKLVPSGFGHCFNNDCPQADSCLRHLVAKHSVSGDPFIRIINPAYYPADGNACTHFKQCQKVRMAWGIVHLYDNLPSKIVPGLRSQLICHFTKALYYRFYRKEYAIIPRDQLFIRQQFKQRGISEEPAFEYYTEEYEW